jgi:hypothetical protein
MTYTGSTWRYNRRRRYATIRCEKKKVIASRDSTWRSNRRRGCMMIRYKTEMVMTSWLYMAIESLTWTFLRHLAVLSFFTLWSSFIWVLLICDDLHANSWMHYCTRTSLHGTCHEQKPSRDCNIYTHPELEFANIYKKRRFTWHAEVNFIMRVEHVPTMPWPSTQG